MSRGRARYTESDVARILRAAVKARIDVRVKIDIDGSILIATDMPSKQNNVVNPWDEVLLDAAEQKRPS